MPTQMYKTTKPYATRFNKLAKRVINQRYEGHNLLTTIDRLITQIEQKFDYIDQKAALRAQRAKEQKAEERKQQEQADVISEQAEPERTEDTEGNGEESSAATLPAGSDG